MEIAQSLSGVQRKRVATVQHFEIGSGVCGRFKPPTMPLLWFWKMKMDPSLPGVMKTLAVTVWKFEISSRVCSKPREKLKMSNMKVVWPRHTSIALLHLRWPRTQRACHARSVEMASWSREPPAKVETTWDVAALELRNKTVPSSVNCDLKSQFTEEGTVLFLSSRAATSQVPKLTAEKVEKDRITNRFGGSCKSGFKVSPCFTAFLRYSLLRLHPWHRIHWRRSASWTLGASARCWRFFVVVAMRPKHQGRQYPNSDEEHRDFVLKINMWCFLFLRSLFITIQHCKMQCDVEMYWICLRWMFIQNSVICLSGAIHAGMRSKSFCRTAALGISAHFETVMWFAAQNLTIQTWNAHFLCWRIFKQKIHSFEPFGSVSEQGWFGIKLAHSTRNCFLCYVFSSEISVVCSPNLLFHSLPSHFSWPRWGVLFEDRWRLRPHNYAKWLKRLGYAWIGSYKKSILPAFGSKGNFFQLSFKSFHFTPRSNVLLQTTDKFAQLEEMPMSWHLDFASCDVRSCRRANAKFWRISCWPWRHRWSTLCVEIFNSAAVLPLSNTFHAFVQFWWYCPITSHFWVDLLFVSCTVPCTSIIWCIGNLGKRKTVSVFTAGFAWNWCFISWQNTDGLRTVLDLVVSCWVISIAQHCTRCHERKVEQNLMWIRLEHFLAEQKNPDSTWIFPLSNPWHDHVFFSFRAPWSSRRVWTFFDSKVQLLAGRMKHW